MVRYVQCGIAWCRFESNDSPLPCHNQRPACPNNTLTPYDEDDCNDEDIDDDADRADKDGEDDDEEEDEGDSGGIAITIPMLGSDLDLADSLNKTSPPPRHTLMIVVIIGMET